MIRSRSTADRLDGSERPRALVPVVWAGGGFVAGVVFWHLIGFWSMVSGAVLGDRTVPVSEAPAVARRKAASPIETGSVPPRAMACVALTLNRRTGETRGADCQTGIFHHINAGLGSKDDRETGSSGWSATVK